MGEGAGGEGALGAGRALQSVNGGACPGRVRPASESTGAGDPKALARGRGVKAWCWVPWAWGQGAWCWGAQQEAQLRFPGSGSVCM